MSLARMTDLKSTTLPAVAQEAFALGVIPLGATEQHGPHLPLGTDSFILEHLLTAVAASIQGPLVTTPTVAVGHSPYHASFAGTISTGKRDLVVLIEGHIDALVRAGFSRIAVVSHHGGNFGPLSEACSSSRERYESHIIAGYSDLDRYVAVELAAARGTGAQVPESDVHAGAIETSLMMYLTGEPTHSEIVAVKGFVGPTADGWIERIMEDGIESLSAVGVLGDPRVATPAIGQAVFEALVEEFVEWFTASFIAAGGRRDPATTLG